MFVFQTFPLKNDIFAKIGMHPSFHFIKVVLCNRGVGTYEDCRALPIFGSCINPISIWGRWQIASTTYIPSFSSPTFLTFWRPWMQKYNIIRTISYVWSRTETMLIVVLEGEGVGYPPKQFTVVIRKWGPESHHFDSGFFWKISHQMML